MTDARAIAVIDIGKTNAKLVVWDANTHAILFETSCPNRSIDGPPYRHLDVEGLWDFYKASLKDAAGQTLIGRIVVTTHGATVTVLAGDELALPVVDYENTYAPEINHAYDSARDDFADSQSPCLPAGLNFGRQIFALEQTFPEEMARATDFLPYPQYWAWRLSGIKACEVTSLGCHSDLWNPYHADWSQLAKARGWAGKFAPMRGASDVLGNILPEIAAETGLPPDCEIHCGIHDSNASLVPLITKVKQPFSLVSSGTWTICFSVGGDARPQLDEHRDTLCNVDLNGNVVPSARFMGGREYAFLAEGHTDNPNLSDIKLLIASECLAIPSFAEAGGPFGYHSGHLINKAALRTERDKVALATIYCALMIDYALEMISSEGPVIFEGPFATNTAMCQLLASLRTDQQIFASKDSCGTSYGAAILTGRMHQHQSHAAARIDPIADTGILAYKNLWRLKLLMIDKNHKH